MLPTDLTSGFGRGGPLVRPLFRNRGVDRYLHCGVVIGERPGHEVVGGHGVIFELGDGRRVIDGSNTGGPLGHQHPDMVEAIRSSAHLPVINEGWNYAERDRAAEDLVDIAFAGEHHWVGAVRFFLSGSEANDMALSFAQALSGRTAVATRERAYHGLAGLSRAVTVQPQWHGGFLLPGGGTRGLPVTLPVRILPAPMGAEYGTVEDSRPTSARLVDAERLLEGTAATIIDYSQGGAYHDPVYQDRVAAAARQTGSIWIADEVVTGLGRYGRWFAFQGGASRPDIVTLGKPLAGGAAPAAAMVLSKRLVEALRGMNWQTWSTFRAHPTAMRCVRAYLNVMRRDGILSRVAQLEARIRARMFQIGRSHPSVARIDGRGLHWTVELHGPSWRSWFGEAGGPALASLVAERALEAGAMIATSGEQTSLYIAPALVISDSELDELLTALDYGLDAADEQHARSATMALAS